MPICILLVEVLNEQDETIKCDLRMGVSGAEHQGSSKPGLSTSGFLFLKANVRYLVV